MVSAKSYEWECVQQGEGAERKVVLSEVESVQRTHLGRERLLNGGSNVVSTDTGEEGWEAGGPACAKAQR